MFRFIIILLFCVFCITILHAQTIFSGRVFENKTRVALHGVIVQDLNNHLRSITDESGRFSIAAKVGDVLVFRNFAYQTDTLALIDMHDKEIFLEPQRTQLKQVTVTDSSALAAAAEKNTILPYDPQFHGQTMVYHRDKYGDYDGGVIFRLHYFKGDEHKKKIAQQKEEERVLNNEISTLFTPDNVSHYLPLRGADLTNFLLLYTPTVRVYNSKDFNLLTYLNACYKEWLGLGPQQRKAGHIFKKE